MTDQLPPKRRRDYAIIIEALARYAGNPSKLETARERRAWHLIDELGAIAGEPPSDLLDADLEQISNTDVDFDS